MGDLLEWLLKKENKKICRLVGIFLLMPFVTFFFGGGFHQGVEGEGMIFPSDWFREIFIVIISLMFLVGLILVVAGFSSRKNQE